MNIREFIIVSLLCLFLGACSIPSTAVKAVAIPSNSVAFDLRMKGCWGLNTGCSGVISLSVCEVSTARTMWEVDLPSLRSGRVTYGRVPEINQLEHFEYQKQDEWPEQDNPGFRKPLPLPKSTDLVAIVEYRYDGPWPNAGASSLFFRIEPDGSIRRLWNRSLSELYQNREQAVDGNPH
jgi:hypothetical protein